MGQLHRKEKEDWMKRGILLIVCFMVLAVGQVWGQGISYDPFYVLPGDAGVVGVELGFITPDASQIGEVSDIDLMAKGNVANGLEVGVRAIVGVLNDTGDDLSSVTLGGKWAVGKWTAITANLTPLNDREETGFSIGLMHSVFVGGIGVNGQVLVGFGKGYAPEGKLIEGLIQPVLPLGEKVVTYLDVLMWTDTEKPGGRLGILLAPNVDLQLREGLALNGGIQFSVYSGKWITRDTDLGLNLRLFQTAALW
jgi:hypothetical protein